MQRFIIRADGHEIPNKNEGLVSFLASLEGARGCILSNPYYAILLREAINFKPQRHWAIWDFSIVPITDVFNNRGQPVKEYAHWFTSMSDIYDGIKKSKNKRRVFAFKDNIQKSKVQHHKGWVYLKKLHRQWGCITYECTQAELLGRIDDNITKGEDLVYCHMGTIIKAPWIIAKKNDNVKLIHDKTTIRDIRTLFNGLFRQLKPILEPEN